MPTAGALDPTFGAGGIVTTAVGTGDDKILGLAAQADGKVVAVGYGYNGSTGYDFAVARYNPAGTLDASFAAGGKALTPFSKSNGSDEAHGVALQGDGKVVVAGAAFARYDNKNQRNVYNIGLARYNANGTLDATFGTGGKVTTSFTTSSSQMANAVALQADGKVVVAGWVDNASRDFALARYNANGTLDATFGTGGKVSIDFASGSIDQATGVAVQADGRIVVEGNVYLPGPGTYLAGVARVNANGTLDATFGSGGKVTRTLGQNSTRATGIALQGDGRVLVVGSADNGVGPVGTSVDFAVARFNADGSPDAGFGAGGLATIDLGNQPCIYEAAYAVVLQADGKILAAGATCSDGTGSGNSFADFALVRLNADGSRDATFGNGGVATAPIGTNEDVALAVAVQPDGKAVLGGFTLTGSSNHDFALARFQADAAATPAAVAAQPAPAGGWGERRAAAGADTRVVPFKVTGGGTVPQGLLLVPGGTVPHNATGTATHLGSYTGEGMFTLLGFTGPTTGTFTGSFVFVAANGDRLAFNYGAVTPGTFTIIPQADGKVVVQFVAVFTPDPAHSTGRFADVTGGSFVMVATTEPFDATPNAQGFTAPFAYTWEGEGWLQFGKGGK